MPSLRSLSFLWHLLLSKFVLHCQRSKSIGGQCLQLVYLVFVSQSQEAKEVLTALSIFQSEHFTGRTVDKANHGFDGFVSGVLHFNHLHCLLRWTEEHSSKHGAHPGQQNFVSPNVVVIEPSASLPSSDLIWKRTSGGRIQSEERKVFQLTSWRAVLNFWFLLRPPLLSFGSSIFVLAQSDLLY